MADPSLLQRREQVNEAYKVLSNPELRQAHNRKLAAAAAPRVEPLPVRSVAEPSPYRKPIALALVGLALYAGVQWWMARNEVQRELQRQQTFALENEAKQLEAQRAAADMAQRNQEATEQRRKAQEEEARERQLRRDSQYASQQTQNIVNQQLQYQRQQTLDEERRIRQTKQDEAQRQREAEYAAQKQQSRDAQQLRNLCIINYGRPNC